MSLIPREYAYLAIILALGGSLWWFAIHEQHKGAEKCLSNQQVQAEKDKAQGEKAVANARALAAEQEAQEAKKQAEQNKAETEAIKQQAMADHAKAQDLQRRYEAQLATDKSCAAWAQEKVACTLE